MDNETFSCVILLPKRYFLNVMSAFYMRIQSVKEQSGISQHYNSRRLSDHKLVNFEFKLRSQRSVSVNEIYGIDIKPAIFTHP